MRARNYIIYHTMLSFNELINIFILLLDKTLYTKHLKNKLMYYNHNKY